MLDGSKTATDARFFALALRVGVYCLLWFVTSIAVIYTNKTYMTHKGFALLGNRKLPKKSTEITKMVNYPGFQFHMIRTTLY